VEKGGKEKLKINKKVEKEENKKQSIEKGRK